jgi:hypothetical protein
VTLPAPRNPDRTDYEVVAEYPGVVTVIGWKNLAVCSWTGQATGQVVEAITGALDRPAVQGYRQSYVHLIRDKLGLPDAEARSSFLNTMKARHNDLACIAIVVGGTGFWASAMRNALIGLRVLAPRSFDFRLHGHVNDVLEWLPAAHEKQTGVALSSDELQRMLEFAQNTYGDPGAQP